MTAYRVILVVLALLISLTLTGCVAPQAYGPAGLRSAYDRIFTAGDIWV